MMLRHGPGIDTFAPGDMPARFGNNDSQQAAHDTDDQYSTTAAQVRKDRDTENDVRNRQSVGQQFVELRQVHQSVNVCGTCVTQL